MILLVLLLRLQSQLVQRILHLSVTVIDDLIKLIYYLYEPIPLQIKELLMPLNELLLITLGLIIHFQRLLQINQTVLLLLPLLLRALLLLIIRALLISLVFLRRRILKRTRSHLELFLQLGDSLF